MPRLRLMRRPEGDTKGASQLAADVAARFRTGDTAAVTQVFDHYFERLCLFAAARLGVHGTLDDAQDVVQQVFVRAWTNRSRLPAEVALAACLYEMTRAECADFLRRQHRRTGLLGRHVGATSSGDVALPDEVAHQLLLYQQVLRVIERLPPRCRDAFILRRYEGMTYEEIGAALGITPGTAEQHVWKGHRALRDHLGDLEL